MKRRDEVLVGITATAAIIAGVLGSLWLARGGLQPGYPLYAKFLWGAGLKQGQPVLLSGVNVGYVDEVLIRTDGSLVVRLRVRKSYKVPIGATATIEPNGFFGDQLVALHPSRPNPNSYHPNDTLLSGRPTPQLSDVLMRVDTISQNIAVMTQTLRKEFVDDGGISELRATARHAGALMDQVAKAIDQQNAELTKTQGMLRRAISAVDSMQVDSTVRSLAGAAANAKALTDDLRQTTARLNATLDKLNHGEGSAGKLLSDPALFNDVHGLVTHIDSLMADFKKNPRRYIKLSIF